MIEQGNGIHRSDDIKFRNIYYKITKEINMKKTISLIMLLIIVNTAYGITVDGYCYLDGETNQSGSKILFSADSPSAITDTAYTDIAGYFSIEISPGIYDIIYSHEGRSSYSIDDVFLIDNTTLEDVTLYFELSGDLSDTLFGNYVYHIIGSISVSNADSLIIEPGVALCFMGNYSFTIYGTLLAEGTVNDSILFTSGKPSTNPGDWNGIKFEYNSDDNSIISYANIEYASNGIYCSSSTPTISNNTISNNNDKGIYCVNSSPTISNNTISNNNDNGIYCSSSSPNISNNTIRNNNDDGIYCSSSSPSISNNEISNNDDGIYCRNSSSPTISNNTIRNNYDDGIYCSSSSSTISNNTISNNSDGIYFEHSNQTISNNTISNNGDNGIYFDHSNPTIINNTISNNDDGIYCSYSSPNISNNTISNNGDNGIYFDHSNSTIINNILYDNGTGVRAYSYPSVLSYNLLWLNQHDYVGGAFPPYFGQIIAVNANGDSCDTYCNLFMDPHFVEPDSGNYNLIENSPCIDAGDPDSPLDPDGTVADIGAYYYDQSFVIDDTQELSSYSLYLYPNPMMYTDNTINVCFSLIKNCIVSIDLYNIRGQHIETLINEEKNIGEYVVTKDVSNLSSGIYFMKFNIDGKTKAVNKFVLMK